LHPIGLGCNGRIPTALKGRPSGVVVSTRGEPGAREQRSHSDRPERAVF